MTANLELAAWFLAVGALFGAAISAWFYETAMARMQAQHDAALKAAGDDYKARTAEAVAAVRRESVDVGERHGFERGWREANAVWRVQHEAQARLERRLYAVPTYDDVPLTDEQLKDWFDKEGPA